MARASASCEKSLLGVNGLIPQPRVNVSNNSIACYWGEAEAQGKACILYGVHVADVDYSYS